MSKSTPPESEFGTKNYCQTTATFKQCEFTWKIDQYETIHDKLGVIIKSSTFSADDDDLKWRLRVDPVPESNSYVTISIGLCKDENFDFNKIGPVAGKLDIIVEYDKSLRTAAGAVEARNLSFVVTDIDEYHSVRLCKRKELLNDLYGYLPNDTLTIVAFLSFTNRENMINICNPPNPFTSEVAVPSQLSDDLQQLLVDEEFSDAIISVGGKNYPVHKAILASRSSVFKAMFERDMRERRTNRVDIPDIDAETFEEVRRYIYTGNLTKLEELAFNLLSAADKYNLKQLKRICEQELGKKLSIDNAVDILILADLHHADQLKNQTLRFIRTQTHGTNTMDPIVWDNLSTSYPHLLKDMLGVFVKK